MAQFEVLEMFNNPNDSSFSISFGISLTRQLIRTKDLDKYYEVYRKIIDSFELCATTVYGKPGREIQIVKFYYTIYEPNRTPQQLIKEFNKLRKTQTSYRLLSNFWEFCIHQILQEHGMQDVDPTQIQNQPETQQIIRILATYYNIFIQVLGIQQGMFRTQTTGLFVSLKYERNQFYVNEHKSLKAFDKSNQDGSETYTYPFVQLSNKPQNQGPPQNQHLVQWPQNPQGPNIPQGRNNHQGPNHQGPNIHKGPKMPGWQQNKPQSQHASIQPTPTQKMLENQNNNQLHQMQHLPAQNQPGQPIAPPPQNKKRQNKKNAGKKNTNTPQSQSTTLQIDSLRSLFNTLNLAFRPQQFAHGAYIISNIYTPLMQAIPDLEQQLQDFHKIFAFQCYRCNLSNGNLQQLGCGHIFHRDCNKKLEICANCQEILSRSNINPHKYLLCWIVEYTQLIKNVDVSPEVLQRILSELNNVMKKNKSLNDKLGLLKSEIHNKLKINSNKQPPEQAPNNTQYINPTSNSIEYAANLAQHIPYGGQQPPPVLQQTQYRSIPQSPPQLQHPSSAQMQHQQLNTASASNYTPIVPNLPPFLASNNLEMQFPGQQTAQPSQYQAPMIFQQSSLAPQLIQQGSIGTTNQNVYQQPTLSQQNYTFNPSQHYNPQIQTPPTIVSSRTQIQQPMQNQQNCSYCGQQLFPPYQGCNGCENNYHQKCVNIINRVCTSCLGALN